MTPGLLTLASGGNGLLIPEKESAGRGTEYYFKIEYLFLERDQRFRLGYTESTLNMQCESMST